MRSLRTFAVALLICAAACGEKSPEEKLLKSTEAAAGWVPALQMTAEKWVANSVPASFARSASKAAKRDLENAQKAIAKSDASRDLRERLAADLRAANDFADALGRAAEKDDRRAILPSIGQLKRLDDDLDALEKQYGSGS